MNEGDTKKTDVSLKGYKYMLDKKFCMIFVFIIYRRFVECNPPKVVNVTITNYDQVVTIKTTKRFQKD